jgi:hypothetical protein
MSWRVIGRRDFVALLVRSYAPVCGKRATLGAMLIKRHRMGGTGQPAGMLRGQLFGPWGQYHSRVIGSTGGQCGPLEGTTAEKACRSRALPIDPLT